MEFIDIAFYALDTYLFVTLIKMLKASNEIVFEAPSRNKYIVAFIFFGLAAFGLFKYAGIFLIIQTVGLVLMGVMYCFMKTGVSKRGIVVMGKLYPYNKLSNVKADMNKGGVCFTITAGESIIGYPDEQIKEIDQFLREVRK